MNTTPRTCKANTTSGQPCQGYALVGSEYCFTHDPARAVERRQARVRGGLLRRTARSDASAPETIRTLEGVYSLLDYALAETIEQENSVNRSRVLIALAESYLKAISGQEIDERLTRLEQMLEERSVIR